MKFRLRFDRAFTRSLERLPGDLRSVARRQVRSLADTPRPPHAKELDGHPSYFRLWLPRDYCLVFQVLDEDEVVDLLYIGPKTPDLYAELGLDRPDKATEEAADEADTTLGSEE